MTGTNDAGLEGNVLVRLGVGGAIEGGVEGSDASGEFETGERYCGAFSVVGNCAVGVFCVALKAFVLRLCNL